MTKKVHGQAMPFTVGFGKTDGHRQGDSLLPIQELSFSATVPVLKGSCSSNEYKLSQAVACLYFVRRRTPSRRSILLPKHGENGAWIGRWTSVISERAPCQGGYSSPVRMRRRLRGVAPDARQLFERSEIVFSLPVWKEASSES